MDRNQEEQTGQLIKMGFADAGLSAYYSAQGLHTISHGIRHTSETRRSEIQDLITSRYTAMRNLVFAAESIDGGHLTTVDHQSQEFLNELRASYNLAD